MSLEQLHLFQLVSPALPVGAFSYSEGLEVLVQAGALTDGQAVRAWLEAELQRGLVAIEAAALPALMADLGAAHWDRAAERDGWLLAQREASELRAQQRQMGSSLLQLLADLGWPLPCALAWTGAWAWAGVALQLSPEAALQAYLYGWTANQLSAAVRLVPLGPTEAQRIQLALAPLLQARARELQQHSGSWPPPLFSAGVGAGLAQLRHAELYSRLFRS